MNTNQIAILGSGSMGGAILAGLLASGFNATSIRVSTKSQASTLKHRDELGVNAYSLEHHEDANLLAVAEADIVLLAVKPAYILEVLSQVAPALKAGSLVISVAAGITIESMEAVLPNEVAVVRSMPNTPAIVSRAVTGIARGSRVTGDQLNASIALFETVGKVLVIDESQIDALSTISGSGPAYVFLLIEHLTAAAIAQGFTREQAEVMVHETFLGASELLAASGKTPEELRRQVTSPNGTTMRAVAVLEDADLTGLFVQATNAALARAKEIAAGNL